MPIKSYILIPKDNRLPELIEELSHIEQCEIEKAKNKDVLIAVTDTATEEEDKKTLNQIEACQELAHITMVSGFDEKVIQ